METLVLIIAALILAAGILLWRADASKRTPQSAREEPSLGETTFAEEETPDLPADTVKVPEEEPLPAPVPDQAEAVYADDSPLLDDEAEAQLAEVPEVTGAKVQEFEPEVLPEPAAEFRPQPAAELEEESKGGVEKHTFLNSFPGSQRRERKHWATRHNFDFIREDAFLTDEWSRGAASTGAVARDVVSGMADGYETHLVDLAGVPVMAMRRGVTSEVVIDARRGAEPVDSEREESEDLMEVDTVSGFRLLSNSVGVAQRLIDERVRVALEAMPEAVTAVWMESDWVLAETVKASTAEDWEDMLQPLALLTDASFTLPPRSSAARSLDLALIEPTRLKPEVPNDPKPRSEQVEEDLSQPLVIRPEEPLQMPMRAQQESRGVVEPRALGADDVDSIADGEPSYSKDLYGTRVIRDLNGQSSIFDDAEDDVAPPRD